MFPFLFSAVAKVLRSGVPISCDASSEYDSLWTCDRVYDGDHSTVNGHSWATTGGLGRINLYFSAEYAVTQIDLFARCRLRHQCSSYDVIFSDGSTQTVTELCKICLLLMWLNCIPRNDRIENVSISGLSCRDFLISTYPYFRIGKKLNEPNCYKTEVMIPVGENPPIASSDQPTDC